MPHSPKEIIQSILPNSYQATQETAQAFAPANIALIKYWGKRDKILNLPNTSSLSLSLGNRGTTTQVSQTEKQDVIILNQQHVNPESHFYQRLVNYLSYFRPHPTFYFHIETQNTIPVAAGVASSSSGFAALVKALDIYFDWRLPLHQLSVLARLGSGSACRSLWDGFVLWHKGEEEDGLDSFAEPMTLTWPDLCVGLLMVDQSPKKYGSREAMNHTVETSPLYAYWPTVVEKDLASMVKAIQVRNFSAFGQILEGNACAMHATMLASRPAIIYHQPQTLALIDQIQRLREQGLSIFFSQDAGPNLKLFFLATDLKKVQKNFPTLEVVVP